MKRDGLTLMEYRALRAAKKAKAKDNARFIAKVAGKKRKPSIKSLENKLWDLNTLIVRQRDGDLCKTCRPRMAYFGDDGSPNLGYAQCHIVPQQEGRGLVYDLRNVYWGCSACNKSESAYRGRWQRVIFPQVFGAELVTQLWDEARKIAQPRRPDFERMIAEREAIINGKESA